MWQSAAMPLSIDTAEQTRTFELARAALARPRAPFRELPDRMLIVDVDRQRLSLVEAGRVVASYAVSTAAAGIGGEEGSYRTPPGWHRIHARIGAGEPNGRVFVSRIATDNVWRGEAAAADLILTRVLTLEGVEDGVNRGPGLDSLERYIYVHGTNHEDAIGRPVSHGCVRMTSADVIELFDRVAPGDAVLITGYGGAPVA
jgi:UDP-N-acetylmuramate--alanine ligase